MQCANILYLHFTLLPEWEVERVKVKTKQNISQLHRPLGFQMTISFCQLDALMQDMDDYREAEAIFLLLALLANKQWGPECWGQLWGLDSVVRRVVTRSASAERQAGRAHLWEHRCGSYTSLHLNYIIVSVIFLNSASRWKPPDFYFSGSSSDFR